MRVIFQNEIKKATITALAPNANYPASNLSHVFLKLKYKGLGFSDTITATLPDNVSASGFMYSYSNAKSMTVRVYSNASELLETLTVDCSYSSGSAFFTRHDNVRWIEIDAAAPVSEDLYIGGICLGIAKIFPEPINTFDTQLVDNTEPTTSADFQTSSAYIKPGKTFVLSFRDLDRDEVYHPIVEDFEGVGRGQIWVDITEENHDVWQPLYCTTNLIEDPSRDSYKCAFTLKLTEAR